MLLNILPHFSLQILFSYFPPLKRRCTLWSKKYGTWFCIYDYKPLLCFSYYEQFRKCHLGIWGLPKTGTVTLKGYPVWQRPGNERDSVLSSKIHPVSVSMKENSDYGLFIPPQKAQKYVIYFWGSFNIQYCLNKISFTT